MISRKSDYGPPIYGISGVRKKKTRLRGKEELTKYQWKSNLREYERYLRITKYKLKYSL